MTTFYKVKPYQGTLTVVAPCDPAIDLEGSNLSEYVKDPSDRHLAIKDGETPVRFEVKPLSRLSLRGADIMARAQFGDGGAVEKGRLIKIFFAGVQKITARYVVDGEDKGLVDIPSEDWDDVVPDDYMLGVARIIQTISHRRLDHAEDVGKP